MSATTDTNDILFSVQHHIGLITLNRPNALNALSFSMFKALFEQLQAWQHDDNIHAVVIQAVPGRAFCAGGDVRWVYEVGQEDPLTPLALFKHEYRLNRLISELGKPYIALMDGVTIGGGVGITLHGSHRVASEKFAFSMPEASIGFFPDIGSSHLLSACPGGFGLYLGLTGQRVNAADSKAFGFVDYTVPSTAFSNILGDLFSADLSIAAEEKVSDCIQKYQEKMPAGFSASEINAVSQYFENKAVLRDVFEALEQDGSEWASETQAILQEQSPLSLHIAFEQLRRAKGMNLADCLAMDYGLAYYFLNGRDFYEGVRARLVDKDKAPQWQPATLDAVLDSEVTCYFEKPAEVASLW
ncbi:MAG: enoyl-CoA hydratase/isomerase family protein [Legionella sp.]|nr:enoyl-CoA hydratase/isomerase family protein [Legionella sp.]